MILEDSTEFNAAVRGWGHSTRTALLMRLASLGLSDRVKLRKSTRTHLRKMGVGKEQSASMLTKLAGGQTLYESLKEKYKGSGGEIYFISFPFARHGIFLDKGVSRGHPLSNPRRKVDWFHSIIDAQTAVLSDIIANRYADGVQKEVLRVAGF